MTVCSDKLISNCISAFNLTNDCKKLYNVSLFVTCRVVAPRPSVASVESVLLNLSGSSKFAARNGRIIVENSIKITSVLLGCVKHEVSIAVERGKNFKNNSPS